MTFRVNRSAVREEGRSMMVENVSRDVCLVCKKTDEEVSLDKCAICFKLYCDDHGFVMSGRRFCSRFCAEYFFFSGPDE